MSGINKVILVGNLGANPITNHTTAGQAITNISIATSVTWNDKTTGDAKERTEWHRVAIFGKLAEIAEQFLTKGSKVYVEGKLQTRKYLKDGQERYTTEIIVSGYDGTLQMLDKREGSGGSIGGIPPMTDDDHPDDIPF